LHLVGILFPHIVIVCRRDTNSRRLIIRRASSNTNTNNNGATSNQVFIEGKLQFSNSFKRHSLTGLLPGLRRWNGVN